MNQNKSLSNADRIIIESYNKAEIVRRSKEQVRNNQILEDNLKRLSKPSKEKIGIRSRTNSDKIKESCCKCCKCVIL